MDLETDNKVYKPNIFNHLATSYHNPPYPPYQGGNWIGTPYQGGRGLSGGDEENLSWGNEGAYQGGMERYPLSGGGRVPLNIDGYKCTN